MLSQHAESTSWGGAPDYLSNSLGTPISICDLCKQCRSSTGDGVTSLLQKARAMRAWKDSQEGAAGARAAGRAGEGAVMADEVAAAAGVEAGGGGMLHQICIGVAGRKDCRAYHRLQAQVF